MCVVPLEVLGSGSSSEASDTEFSVPFFILSFNLSLKYWLRNEDCVATRWVRVSLSPQREAGKGQFYILSQV